MAAGRALQGELAEMDEDVRGLYIAMGQYSSFCVSAVVITLGVVDIEDAVQRTGRMWKRRGKRLRETREGQNEDTTNRQSNTHRGWHEDGMSARYSHIGWLVMSHAVSMHI